MLSVFSQVYKRTVVDMAGSFERYSISSTCYAASTPISNGATNTLVVFRVLRSNNNIIMFNLGSEIVYVQIDIFWNR